MVQTHVQTRLHLARKGYHCQDWLLLFSALVAWQKPIEAYRARDYHLIQNKSVFFFNVQASKKSIATVPGLAVCGSVYCSVSRVLPYMNTQSGFTVTSRAAEAGFHQAVLAMYHPLLCKA